MIVKYKHGEPWDCIGFCWGKRNLKANFYAMVPLKKVCQILLKIRKRLNFGGISKMHNCCCIVKNRICVGLFAKQPPRVANNVETVTRIFKTLCQKLTYVMCRKKHHNFLCVHKQPSSAKRGICNLSDLITYSRLMIVLTKTFT